MSWFLRSDLFLLMQNKDTVDTKSRGANNTSSRGTKSGSDRNAGRGRTSVLISAGTCTLFCGFTWP